MKKIAVIVFMTSLLLVSCETLSDLEQGVSGLSGSVAQGSSATTMQGEVDFRKNEVLCSTSGDADRKDAQYLPALIQTEPTPATQNQAEVLYPNGDKAWTYIVLPSRKATDADLAVGEEVIYMYYHSGDENMTQEKYRTHHWQIGTVTSTAELFKGVVEVDGRPMFVKWVRVEL